MDTTWGCSWSLVELVGSFLMNPPVILFIPLLNTKCRDGNNNFEENRGNYVFFLNKENFLMYFLFSYRLNSSLN